MKKYVYPLVSAFCIGLVATLFVVNIIVNNPDADKKVQPTLVDVLPLENGGEVSVKVIDGVKYVHFTFSDFEYVAKKRSITKKVVKSLESLFARLEG